MGTTEQIPASQNTQQKLRAALDSRGWGVRTLAREMARRAEQPHRVESLRRQLKRYLSATDTVVPSTATRHAMEDALESERDSLKADADDSEEAAEPMAQFMAPLMHALEPFKPAIRMWLTELVREEA